MPAGRPRIAGSFPLNPALESIGGRVGILLAHAGIDRMRHNRIMSAAIDEAVSDKLLTGKQPRAQVRRWLGGKLGAVPLAAQISIVRYLVKDTLRKCKFDRDPSDDEVAYALLWIDAYPNADVFRIFRLAGQRRHGRRSMLEKVASYAAYTDDTGTTIRLRHSFGWQCKRLWKRDGENEMRSKTYWKNFISDPGISRDGLGAGTLTRLRESTLPAHALSGVDGC